MAIVLFTLHPGAEAGDEAPLMFWDAADIADPLGAIRFGAEMLENEGSAEGYPDMQYGCEVPHADGIISIYGWRIRDWDGPEGRLLQIVRCTTEDGRTFADEEVVFEYRHPRWQAFVNIVRHPDGALYLFSWADWPGRLHVFRSETGIDWELLSENALQGHDAMCIVWHEPTGRFINYQTVVQPHPKRYPDNIGELRRVLSFLSSTDGEAWEPFSPDFLKGETLWLPDADDPIDLEFYRVVVFPLQGRFALLLADYVPPPSESNSRRAVTKHGPPYLCEWAISRDGLNWARPFRDTNAYEHQFWLSLQGPLFREGRLRFYHPDGRIASLPEDRVFYVTCRANGEFSTLPFTMPVKGLVLNADVRYRAAEGEHGQAYIMAEVLDAAGEPVPGYERKHCLFENEDGQTLPMKWGEKTGEELAGDLVRLRFYLRDAKIYGVAGASP
jgi:hypothetical protein